MQVAKSYSLAMEGVGKIGYRGDREYAEPTLNGKVAYSNSSKADMEGSGFNSGVVDNIMHQMKGHKGQFVFGVGIGEEYHSTLVVAYNNGQKLSQGNKEVIASEDNPIFVFVEDYGGARVMTGQELETVMKSYVEGAALYYSGRRDLGSGPLKLKDPNKPRPLTTHVDNLEAVPTTNQQPATDNQPPQQ